MAYGLYFCSTCGVCHHEIRAEKYDPDTAPNATWFKLMEFFQKNAWGSFPENEPAFKGAELWCPGCGASYMSVHAKTHWFGDDRTYYGQGPDAFREMMAADAPQDTPEETPQGAEPQVYEPPKKGKAASKAKSQDNKRSGKGSSKKREALKNLDNDQEAGNE